jgi:hypothetical protein
MHTFLRARHACDKCVCVCVCVCVCAVCLMTNKKRKKEIASATNQRVRQVTSPEQWVIGAYDRVQKRVALQAMNLGRDQRSRDVANTFIEASVKPMSIIVTDKHYMYNDVKNLGGGCVGVCGGGLRACARVGGGVLVRLCNTQHTHKRTTHTHTHTPTYTSIFTHMKCVCHFCVCHFCVCHLRAGVYHHFAVNHSRRPFPERTVHGVRNLKGVEIGSQRIEQEWNQLRRFLSVWRIENHAPAFRVVQLYCSEFTWRRNIGMYPETQPGSVFRALCLVLGQNCLV